MQSCADCRREIGIDRALVKNLRRALRERVEGSAPSGASWQLVRRRTVDRPERPWTARVVQWGGMASAAAVAAVMLFAVVTTPESNLFPGTQSPFVASAARRAVPPLDEGNNPLMEQSTAYVAPDTDLPLPGWRTRTQISDAPFSRDGEPQTTIRMRGARVAS